MPIQKLKARQIFNSRGDPTLEVDLITDIGLLRSSVPCVFSPNPNGATELRDNNEASYNGRSVFKAVENINNIIAPELLKSKLEVCQQREIDNLMISLDGTENKSRLGANAILAVSMTCCKGGAAKKGLPLYKYIAGMSENTEIVLPVPAFNVISGGKYAGNPLACQEFMILPTAGTEFNFVISCNKGAASFADAMKMGTEVFRVIEQKIAEQQDAKPPLPVSDEGSFAPELEDDKEALTIIDEAIKAAGYDGKIKIALDMSASTFCKDGQYDLSFKSEDSDPSDYLEAEALRDQYLEYFTEFPTIVSIEDPFDEEDWDGWPMLSDQPIQVVADDLTAMNIERIEEAIEKQTANCLLIRLSQIGTVTEAINCNRLARTNGWGCLISGGYGETEDTFIADLAVGISAGQFKAGAPCRSERIAKYNQILRIEEELGRDAKYAGNNFRYPFSK